MSIADIDLLNERAFNTIYQNLEEGWRLTDQAVRLAAENDYAPGIAWGQLNSGLVEMEKGHYDLALEKINQSQHMFMKLNSDVKAQVAVFNALGLVHIRLGRMNKALSYLQDSLHLCSRHPLKSMESTAVNYLGILQFKSEKYNQALRSFQKALKLRTHKNKTSLLNNLGCSARALGQNQKALEYLNKALAQSEMEGKSDARIAILEEIGLTYGQMEDYNKGISYLESAIGLCVGVKRRHMVGLLINLGEQYLKKKDFFSATETIDRAFDLIDDSNRIDHRNIYTLMAELEEYKGHPTNALFNYKEFHRLSDSLKSETLDENLWLFESEQMRRVNKRISAISEMGQKLTAFLDRKEILNTLTHSLSSLFPIDACMIGEITESVMNIEYCVTATKEKRIQSIEIDPPQNIIAWVAKNGYGLKLNNLEQDITAYIPGFKNNLLPFDSASVLCLPFETIKGKGAIGIYSAKLNQFSDEDRDIMDMLCSFGGIALNNSYQAESLKVKNRKLMDLNKMDSLTQIYNRRHILTSMDKSWMHCRRRSSFFHVILMDADNFKNINDNFGHDAGDQCLKIIGQVLRETLHRSSDSYGRYGGEEFLISIQDISPEEACKQADKIRNSIEKSEQEFNGKSLHFTVSMGVCSILPTQERTVELSELIKEADLNMYRSKKTGRNRVSHSFYQQIMKYAET